MNKTQILGFESPIPSCFIHNIEYKDGKIIYNYLIDTPIELSDSIEEELVIYNQISYLRLVLKSEMNNISANIPINSLSEYRSYLDAQRTADIQMRERFRQSHPDMTPRTIVLEKRNYSRDELYNLDVEYVMEVIVDTEDILEVTCYG